MIRKFFGAFTIVIAAAALLSLGSCAHGTQLTGITIQPTSATFGAVDPALTVQLKAFGTYIHPPKTVDITSQVTWQSDAAQVAQVTGAGVVSPDTDCGTAQVFAEMHDHDNDIVSNDASILVEGPASSGCTPAGAQPTITINFAGTAGATGTVTGSGVSCTTPGPCTYQFPAGTTLTLTATATGSSTFGGWNNCNSNSGTNNDVCTVVLENNVSLTATFN
jgi:hypothetical protein